MNNDKKMDKLNNWKYSIPICLLVFIVPLIVRVKSINLTPLEIQNWNGNTVHFDFFSYYKMVFIVLLALASIIFLLIKQKNYSSTFKIKRLKIYIPIAAYILLVIMSTLFSDYKKITFFGFVDRYEGVLVIVSYIAIMFVTINIANDVKTIKGILYSLILSATLIGIIGLFQYFGLNPFDTDFGKFITMPGKYAEFREKINFAFGDHAIYSTLYHYNYVGSYMAMLFPLTFTMFLLSKNKTIKITLVIISILMLFILIACGSRAGFVGAAFSVFILVVMIRKHIFRNWKIVVPSTLIVLITVIGIGMSFGNEFGKRISTILDGLKSTSVSVSQSEKYELKDISVQGNKASFTDSDITLKLELIDGQLIFKDSDDKAIQVNFDSASKKINLIDDRFSKYNFQVIQSDNTPIIDIQRGDMRLDFALMNEEFKFYDLTGHFVDIKPVEKWGFEGKETMGSARGYIWSRSIPLLKNTIIVGYGADTFSLAFPQYDYVGKYNAYGTVNMLVDKPHNLYLNTAISTGILSLIALLVVFGMYAFSSLKLYLLSNFDTTYEYIGLAIFTAVCGYLAAAMFNDSVVSVAPVFWVLLGLGISINYHLSNIEKVDLEK